MRTKLSEMNIKWSGVDDLTPAGHITAVGTDALGNIRVWLFQGDALSEDGLRGSVLLPSVDKASSRLTAYGPTGTYVRSGYDQRELLAVLAAR